MGDEFSESMDDFGSDIEMPDMGPEPVMDIPEDIPMDIPEDIPMDMPEDIPMDMPEDIPMDIPEDIPEEIPEEIPAEIPEYAPSDTLEQGYIDSPVDDLGAADPAALEGYDQAAEFNDELSGNEPELMEEDVIVDIPHDLPEDIPSDMPEDIPSDIPENVPEDIPEDIPSDMPEDVPPEAAAESDRPALEAMSDYMAEHNYGQEDAAEYMNDPEWQELNRNLQAEDGIERSPQQDMQEYMAEHNYSQEDAAEYMNDPEWQEINRDLQAEDGIERSPQQDMMEYMAEHNYSREDASEYMNDPEWQEINNKYLESQGQEPIEYPDTSAEIPDDVPTDMPEDIPTDVPDDIPTDVPDDIPTDVPEDIPTDVPEDIPTDMPDDVPDDIPTDVPDDIPADVPTDVPEDVQTEQSASEAMQEYMDSHGYTMEDMEEFTKDPEWQELNRDAWTEFGAQYEQAEDVPTDVPYDTATDMPDDVPTDMPEDVPADVQYDTATDMPDDVPTDMPSDIPAEHPAQDGLDEYLSGHDYDLDDAEEYRQDPEWQQLNRDVMIESGLDPDNMEEIVPGPEEITPDTVERVDGVAQELERGDFETMVELEAPDFYTNGEFLEQAINEYGYEGTCGETTQANTLNKLFETNQFTENNVLDVAVQNDLCEISLDPSESGGTTTDQFMKLYEKMDEQLGGGKIEAECYEYDDALPMMEIANQLDEGKIVNVAVDSGRLWDMPQNYVDKQGNPVDEIASDHWIAVTGVNRDAAGNLQSFDILDSGGGETNVSARKFGEMVYGSSYHKVIDPTVIVVSKKA